MNKIQDQISHLLTILEGLLNLIASLRERKSEIETSLAQVQGNYDDKLGSINAEAEKLEMLKADFRARLETTQVSENNRTNDETPLDTDNIAVNPPPEVIAEKSPDPPLEDPRNRRKRALADHIFYFIEDSQETGAFPFSGLV